MLVEQRKQEKGPRKQWREQKRRLKHNMYSSSSQSVLVERRGNKKVSPSHQNKNGQRELTLTCDQH